MVALDGLDKRDALGTFEVAMDMLVSSKLAEHSLAPLKVQLAAKPIMVQLVFDKEEQKALLEVMAQMYAYVYTDEEITAIKNFYITDAGQKMLKNANALGIRAMMVLQDWLADLGDKAEAMGENFRNDSDLPEIDRRGDDGIEEE